MRRNLKTVSLIGIFVLATAVIFLFSGPHHFASSVSFLDTELSRSSDGGQSVRVKMNLGHQETLENFPYQIGNWYGVDEDITGLKEQLGAETLIKRSYVSENPFRPVFLLLMQSANRASFHPPPVCYQALGYDIEEESKDIIYVTDTSWVSRLFDRDLEEMPEWMQKDWEGSPKYGTISVKKLVVNNQDQSQQRVVYYVYIKDKKITSNTVSMLRVSTVIPPLGTYQEASEQARIFMGEVIPQLFEPKEEEEKTFLAYILGMGVLGYFIVAVICAVPVSLIVVPFVLDRKPKRHLSL